MMVFQVDYYGTVNLVEACRKLGVTKFVLVSSILVNGAAMGQLLNPAYVFLNAFGLVLVAKLQAEQYIRKSGINYTIIRPGGLKNDPPNGNVVMEPEVIYVFCTSYLFLENSVIYKRLDSKRFLRLFLNEEDEGDIFVFRIDERSRTSLSPIFWQDKKNTIFVLMTSVSALRSRTCQIQYNLFCHVLYYITNGAVGPVC